MGQATGRAGSIASEAVDGTRAGGDHSGTKASAAYALSSPSATMGSDDSMTQSAHDTTAQKKSHDLTIFLYTRLPPKKLHDVMSFLLHTFTAKKSTRHTAKKQSPILLKLHAYK